jgi:hypothetical protein
MPLYFLAHHYELHRGVYIMQSCLIAAVIVTFVIQNFNHVSHFISIKKAGSKHSFYFVAPNF